jgi:hypothetical protein
VLRLSADDGEASASADVTVEGQAPTRGLNVAAGATPTAEFTAGWNRVGAVNNGTVLHSGGDQTEVWATWSGNHPATRWLQYEWAEPVRVSATEVSFWRDQSTVNSTGGVNVPRSWKAQYWDGGSWVDVPSPGEYGVARDESNETTFDAVTTTRMRLVMNAMGSGSTYAAVGVSEWRVFADAPVAIEPIDVRTEVGVVPALPTTVDATYSDGSHADVGVSWAGVAADQVAGEGSFAVAGIVPGSPVPASATVWVRATPPGQINQVDAVVVGTKAGVEPDLPATVGVLYNDGSREDLPVEWEPVDAADYAQDGEFAVDGAVQTALPGTTAVVATVTVGEGSEGPDTQAPSVSVSVAPDAPGSSWFTGDVTVSATATDNRDPVPAIEARVDGGPWAAYSDPVVVSADGEHTVELRATDASGNSSQVRSAAFKIDTVAPELTIVTDAVSRTVKASASDGASGVAAVEYRLAGETDWRPVTGTILVGLEETRLELRATDVAGNASAIQERTVPVSDGNHRRNVALLATPTASVTAGWNRVTGLNDDVQPTSSGDVTPNDNVNVWGAWPEIGEQWVQYDWAEPVRIGELGAYFVSNLDGNGQGIEVPAEWRAEYWDAEAGEAGGWDAVEAEGEYGTEVDAFNVVGFAPVTTERLRLVLTASGTVSGAGSLGIKEWQVHEAPPVETPDTVAPVVATVVEPATPASGWHTGTVRVTASALDDRDTAPSIEVLVGDGEWTAYADGVEVVDDGVHAVRFRATDDSGNTSEPVTVEVRRDATKPTVSLAFDADTRTVSVGSADAGSGVAQVELKLGDGDWVAYSVAVAAGDAATTAAARVTDLAGNVSEAAELAVPAKPADPGTEPGTDPGTDPEPAGSLTGDEVLRLGVTQIAPGGRLPVTISGAQPGAVFAVEFRSTPTRIGTLVVGEDGTGTGVFTVPANAEAGLHSVALVLPGGEITASVTVVTPGAAGPSAGTIASTGVSDATGVVLWIAVGGVLLGLATVLTVAVRRRRTAE